MDDCVGGDNSSDADDGVGGDIETATRGAYRCRRRMVTEGHGYIYAVCAGAEIRGGAFRGPSKMLNGSAQVF